MLHILIILNIVLGTAGISVPCNPRNFGSDSSPSIVCVCNATTCDTIEEIETAPEGQYLQFVSNMAGLRFQKSTGYFTSKDNCIMKVDSSIKYQSIIGFGGAFTDATGININSLSNVTADCLLRSYFSKDGIEYNMGRVPLAATDFSTHAYSYDDGTVDINLARFALAPEDYKYKIPYILRANDLTNDNLFLFGSAWTAPKWMKSNGQYTNGYIEPEYNEAWANYHLKFLEAYKENNISFWGITTGNEPFTALLSTSINSNFWTPFSQAKYVTQNLAPTVKAVYEDIKILCLDDDRFALPWWIYLMGKSGIEEIDGVAVHWYADDFLPPFLLDLTQYAIKDKFILATEACTGSYPWDTHVLLGSWHRGESYAHSIIQDLNHWVTGWVDWNMALNTTGGPSYINNNVDSPIIVNGTADEFYKQPMFYALGHFSKFLPRGSTRIYHTNYNLQLQVVAFERPDKGIVLIILNKGIIGTTITIKDVQKGSIETSLTANSITTIVYW